MEFATSGPPDVDLLIDSGAFTIWTEGLKTGRRLDLMDDYCQFLKQYRHLFWDYIAMDVIGEWKDTMRNLEHMLGQGLNPRPVLTLDMPLSLMPELNAVKGAVCIAGAVGKRKTFYMQRVQLAHREVPESRLHGLGFCAWPEIVRLPLDSVDSSSYIRGQMTGHRLTFSTLRGISARGKAGGGRGRNSDEALSGYVAFAKMAIIASARLRVFCSMPDADYIRRYLEVWAEVVNGRETCHLFRRA